MGQTQGCIRQLHAALAQFSGQEQKVCHHEQSMPFQFHQNQVLKKRVTLLLPGSASWTASLVLWGWWLHCPAVTVHLCSYTFWVLMSSNTRSSRPLSGVSTTVCCWRHVVPQPLKPFNFSSVLTKFKTPAVKCCGLHYNAIRAEQVSCLVQVISTENKQKSTQCSFACNLKASSYTVTVATSWLASKTRSLSKRAGGSRAVTAMPYLEFAL